MPLLKKIIKNDNREIIVKWTGDGTDTLLLSSLTAVNQTLTGLVPPAADITAVCASISAAGIATIVRNSETVLNIHDNFDFQTDGIISAILNENSSFDVVVTLAAPGTLIIKFRKTQGYTGV